MNSTQIDCFLKAAEELNFTRAAAALYLSQQAVSKYINNLELDLGVELFRRKSSALELTAAGKHFYTLFRAKKQQQEFLSADAKVYYTTRSYQFKLGISEWISPFGAFRAGFEQFRRQHSATRLSMRVLPNQALLDALLSGQVDVALFSQGQLPNHRDLVSAPLAEDEVHLFGPKDAFLEGDPLARQSTLLSVPAWEWGYTERKVLGARERSRLDLMNSRVKELPNLSSLVSEMSTARYLFVAGRRFSFLSDLDVLSSISLNETDYLACTWRWDSEHPLLPAFIQSLRETFGYVEEEAVP